MSDIQNRDWSRDLAWSGPPPGGGSAAAVGAALALGILIMLARAVAAETEQLEVWRKKALTVAGADEAVLRRLLQLFSSGALLSPEEILGAVQPLLQLLDIAVQALETANKLKPQLAAHMQCDLEVAIWQLAAALRGGAAIVALNLSLLAEGGERLTLQQRMEAAVSKGETILQELQQNAE
nr:cyclodeaminase/cyclohydrolase family protein [uncultured Anaeromusa sp.]